MLKRLLIETAAGNVSSVGNASRSLQLVAAVETAVSGELPGDIPIFSDRGSSSPHQPNTAARAGPLISSSSSSSSSASTPAQVSRPGVTLSWYVNAYGATNTAVLQAVLHRAHPSMLIDDWEFASKGDTVLSVGLSGQLPIPGAGGGYVIRVESGDAFALWLGGRRLMLVDDPAIGGAGTAESGQPVWTARVVFEQPGANYCFGLEGGKRGMLMHFDWQSSLGALHTSLTHTHTQHAHLNGTQQAITPSQR